MKNTRYVSFISISLSTLISIFFEIGSSLLLMNDFIHSPKFRKGRLCFQTIILFSKYNVIDEIY